MTNLEQNKAEPVVRWGIVGLGGVVVNQIAPGIARSANSRLVACVGRTPEKTREFAQKFNVERVYASAEELAADPGIDAIYIATPNALHRELVLLAARARKHVLCEKPLALSVEDGEEMVAACEQAGVILRVAFQIRYEAILQRVREVIQSGALGELRLITFERIAPLGERGAWRKEFPQGGIVFDVAVHLIDQVRWLTGLRFREFLASSHPDRRDGQPDDTIAIIGRLGDGCHAMLRASRELPFAGNDLVVEGTRGMLATSALRWLDEYTLRIRDAAGERREHIPATPIYQREIEAFARELRGERSLLPGGEDGVELVRLTDAVIESIATRRAVAV